MTKPAMPEPALPGSEPAADTATPQAAPAATDAAIAALLQEGEQWRDKALRYAADFENFKKRSAQELESARLYASQSFARDMLTVADNLARALTIAETEHNKPLLDGVQMVAAHLEQTFKRHGIAKIIVKPGEPLNPDLHQVMTEAASDYPPGSVVQELQPGYTLHGRLLRPTFVSVAAKAEVKP
jgi:molecular chaperone GrpE